MAVVQTRRVGHSPVFYKALNSLSTADFLYSTTGPSRQPLQLTITDTDGEGSETLPEGCYEIDQVVAERK